MFTALPTPRCTQVREQLRGLPNNDLILTLAPPRDHEHTFCCCRSLRALCATSILCFAGKAASRAPVGLHLHRLQCGLPVHQRAINEPKKGAELGTGAGWAIPYASDKTSSKRRVRTENPWHYKS